MNVNFQSHAKPSSGVCHCFVAVMNVYPQPHTQINRSVLCHGGTSGRAWLGSLPIFEETIVMCRDKNCLSCSHLQAPYGSLNYHSGFPSS